MGNIAFIDGQNLHLGTKADNWQIDWKKFKIYLEEKYRVYKACYFIGYKSDSYNNLYTNLEEASFTIVFKEHQQESVAQKKGNIDTDLVFEIMRNLIDNRHFSKIILVSGDGDYKKLVDYLIQKNRFEKIVFPNKKFTSSLYRNLDPQFFDFINAPSVRHKIEFLKRKKTLGQ